MANIELDGSNKTIKVDTGDLTLDVPGEIHFDADGAIIRFKDNGTAIGTFENVSSDFIIKSSISDQDLIFKGNDGGSAVTALTLDMSDAGSAYFNNKVGIGETSPLGTLHVKSADSGATAEASKDELVVEGSANSGISILSGASSQGAIAFGDSGDNDIGRFTYSHSDNSLRVHTNGSEAMRIDSSQNVGIGDSAPDTLLHITQGGEPPAEGMLILEANSASRQLRIQPPTDADNGFIDYKGGNLVFMDDGTEVARFQGTTGFGIGTSSPSHRLHVRGSGDAKVRFEGNANSNTSDLLISHITSGDAGLQFDSNQLNVFAYGDIAFFPNTSNISGSYPNGQSVVFKNSGNVGIGTTSPSSNLHIGGTTPTLTIGDAGAEDTKIVFDGNAQDFYVALDDSEDDLVIGLGSTVGTTPIMSFDESKNVTIHDGTLTVESDNANALMAPLLKLDRISSSPADGDLIGAIRYTARLDNGSSAEFAGLEAKIIESSAADGEITLNIAKGGNVRSALKANNTEVIINDASEDIDFRVESDGNANMLFVEGGTNRVGVGFSSPQVTLHTDGEIASSATSVNADTSKYLSIQGNGDTSFINHTGSGDLTFRMGSGFATAMTVRSSGLAIGGTGDANTLDDYEEGTWTPVISANATPTAYGSQVGVYTKVGRKVTIIFTINISTIGSFTGAQVKITGLPFASGDLSTHTFGTLFIDGAASEVQGAGDLALRVTTDSSQALFQRNSGNTDGDNNVSASVIDTGTFIHGSVTYFTD